MFHISYFSDKIRQDCSDPDLLIYFSQFSKHIEFFIQFSGFFDRYILDKYLQPCKFNLLFIEKVDLPYYSQVYHRAVGAGGAKGVIAFSDFGSNKSKSKDLQLLLALPDFQTFLRPWPKYIVHIEIQLTNSYFLAATKLEYILCIFMLIPIFQYVCVVFETGI